MPIYRSLKDLELVSYFAFPPQSDVIKATCIDGSEMKILACRVSIESLWRFDAGLNLLTHRKTGLARSWVEIAIDDPYVSNDKPSFAHSDRADVARGHAELVRHENAVEANWQTRPLTGRVLPDLTKMRNARPAPQAKRFRAGDVSTHPREYFTDKDIAEIRERTSHAMIDLCMVADFLPYDQQLMPKLAVRMRELFERELHSTVNYGHRLRDELRALERASLGGEIDASNLYAKERQLHYLKAQWFLIDQMSSAVEEAYDHVVATFEGTGKKALPYKPLAERGKPWKQRKDEIDRRKGEEHSLSMLSRLGPLEFARYVEALRKASPKSFNAKQAGMPAFRGGVDQHEPGLTLRMRHGRAGKPGWDVSHDGGGDRHGEYEDGEQFRPHVHRPIETDGYREYGSEDSDWGYEE